MKLVRRGVGIDADRDASQALDRELGDELLGSVLRNQGNDFAPLQPDARKATRGDADLVAHLPPGPTLPDPCLLELEGGHVRKLDRVVSEQLRKGAPSRLTQPWTCGVGPEDVRFAHAASPR
jgi:hypothetical protein